MHGGWVLGANDPGPWGWGITVAYLLAAGLCFLAGWKAHWKRTPSALSAAIFWRIVAAILLLLGINKQIDLQTPVLHAVRHAAKAGGFYSARRVIQWSVIGSAAVLGAVVLARAARGMKRDPRSAVPVVAGLSFLLIYVVIRASPLRNIDSILGLDVSWIPDKKHMLEMSGIVMVACAALLGFARSEGGNQSSPCLR